MGARVAEELIISHKAIGEGMADPLDPLFKPKSVALIGASANPSKIGHIALRNLSHGRFKLYPINPRESAILGIPCYPSILDVDGPVELAVISLPANASLEPLKQCVRKKVKVVVVSSSGFRESGQAGQKLEEEMLAAIRGTSTRLLGPNTMGIYAPARRLDTLFIPREKSKRPRNGSIAMLSQSGAVSVSFMEKAASAGIGISACVGIGNKADINENELLKYLGGDPKTRCIALYLESFTDGKEFVRVVSEITRHKPVVVLKAGRTAAGSSAARSHTGALATSSDAMVDGVLKQAGAVRAYDEEELIDISKALAYADHIAGDRICVVASAGGYGVIASDYVESKERGAGLKMAELSEGTKAKLREVVPEFSSIHNPVDLTAGVTDEMYESVLRALQADAGTDGIMMSLELQPPNITRRLIEIAEQRSSSDGAKIVISAFGGEYTATMLKEFEKRRIPAYPTIWRAVRALRALADRGCYLERIKTSEEDPS